MPALPDLFSPEAKLIIPCCMLRHRLGADQLKAWCVGCLHSDQRRIYMLFEPVVCATIHRCSQPLVNARNTHSLGSTNRSHLRFLRHRPERSERCLNYEKLYQGQQVCRRPRAYNGRFLRHRFSPKPTSVATPNSLPKKSPVAKEVVSAAVANQTQQQSE